MLQQHHHNDRHSSPWDDVSDECFGWDGTDESSNTQGSMTRVSNSVTSLEGMATVYNDDPDYDDRYETSTANTKQNYWDKTKEELPEKLRSFSTESQFYCSQIANNGLYDGLLASSSLLLQTQYVAAVAGTLNEKATKFGLVAKHVDGHILFDPTIEVIAFRRPQDKVQETRWENLFNVMV